MKKWERIIFIPLFYWGCTYSIKTIGHYDKTSLVVISDKVGEAFDAAERETYKLFPKISGFIEARLYNIEAGGYELEVTTSSGIYRAVYGEEQLPVILTDYIENFDAITRSDSAFINRWQIAAFDQQKLPITMNEVDRVGAGHELGSNVCLLGAMGCIGGGCIGLGISAAYYAGNWFSTESEDLNYTPVIIGAAVGASVSALYSYAAGKDYDRSAAIGAIKKARKLKK